ncbi:MAG: insulinase family protein, partial [Gammaproteobacteria bacterium]|nr:insulinase family protein [Gammaproteobacteria bacterium]
FQSWSASNVELSFELEAERMRNLKLDEEEFAKEINVVLEERRLRTDDNPRALAGEAARAAAFQTSPYRNPVIGWAADLKEMKLVDLAAWYQRWYAPNNAIVVVVGDVDPQAVYKAAQKHFGDFKPEQLEAPKRRPEVPQQGTKRLRIVNEDARLPYLTMAYKAPVLTEVEDADIEEWELYALEVLAATLDGNKASRLPKKLVRRDRVASSISVNYSMANRLRTLFSISATPADGHSPAELEQAIRTELESLRSAPPSPAELARIKTQVVADSLFEQDSPFYQGIIIGSLEAIGLDWRLRDDYVSNIQNVTPEQVQAVARKYLVDDALTVATLLPGMAPATEAAQ